MTKRADFTKEFELEAVRLAETSGRTRKEVAEELSIGLSALARWIPRSRDAGMNDPCQRKTEEDMAAELKRLRCENEILIVLKKECRLIQDKNTSNPTIARSKSQVKV